MNHKNLLKMSIIIFFKHKSQKFIKISIKIFFKHESQKFIKNIY